MEELLIVADIFRKLVVGEAEPDYGKLSRACNVEKSIQILTL